MISFIIGTLGILLLVSDKQDNNAHSTELYHWGIVLGLIAGLTYATYSWVGKTMIQKNISSKASMASMFGFAAIFLLPSLYFTGGQVLHSPMNIAVLLYVALIPMFLGYLMFGYALNHIAASQATLITLLEPAVATILAIVIVGERFSILGGIGLMAIFCCLFVQLVPSRSEFIIKKIDTLE
jgi:DME family drug/metabolite transporter